MFGKNPIAGRKDFKDAGDQLMVTSMFMTLQGEGPLAGQPAFFIRLAKCNLACDFCDTDFDSGRWVGMGRLQSMVSDSIYNYFKGHVPDWASVGPHPMMKRREMALVITGGEPMLQNLGPLVTYGHDYFRNVQIETNGLQWQKGSFYSHTIIVCSPKCVNEKYVRPVVGIWERATCMKFVMSANPHSPYCTLPSWAHEWHQLTERPIYISPMNVYNHEPHRQHFQEEGPYHEFDGMLLRADETVSFWEPGLLNMEQNERNHKWAADYCIKHGYTLNLQMHLYAGLP